MKMMGSLLLGAGCVLLCVRRIREERKKISILQNLIEILAFVFSEIECNLTPLTVLADMCCKRSSGEIKVFFDTLQERLRTGISFEKAWRYGCMKLSLPSEDCRERLAVLGNALSGNEETALRSLAHTQAALQKELEERKRAQREKEKLWVALCCSGTGLMWLMLV